MSKKWNKKKKKKSLCGQKHGLTNKKGPLCKQEGGGIHEWTRREGRSFIYRFFSLVYKGRASTHVDSSSKGVKSCSCAFTDVIFVTLNTGGLQTTTKTKPKHRRRVQYRDCGKRLCTVTTAKLDIMICTHPIHTLLYGEKNSKFSIFTVIE